MSNNINEPSAIAIRPNIQERTLDRLAFEPSNWAEAFKVAEVLVKSRLLPSSVDAPEKAVTIIMRGREFGLTAMQSISSIHVIEGKAVMSADLIVGLVLSSGKAEYFDMVESSSDRCTYATKRRGSQRESTQTWTLDDAKRAGLLNKGNWQKFPAAMLRARCKADLARAVYADVVSGVYEVDEIDGPVIDVRPMTVAERRDEAMRALQSHEQRLGQARMQEVAGFTLAAARKAELTIEDLERAVTRMKTAEAPAAPSPAPAAAPVSVHRHEERTPSQPEQAEREPGSDDDVEAAYVDQGDTPSTPPTSSPALDDSTIDDRKLMALARSAGLRLVDVTRQIANKNPDKLTDSERRTVAEYLMSKGGKS